MLTRLDIRSFKAFGEPAREISITPFMLIVGQNGAGKTSVLQAIELFGLLTRGNLEQALAQRSWDYGDLVHLKSTAASMRFVAHVELDGHPLEWMLELGKRRYPGIAAETVTRDGEMLMRRTGRTMERLDETSGEMVDQVKQTLPSSWLSALEPEDDDRFPALGQLARWARGVRPYVVLDPLVLREPSKTHPHGLGIHGEGLAALLRDLPPKRRAVAVQRAQTHYAPLREVKATRSTGSGVTRLDVVESWGKGTITLGSRQRAKMAEAFAPGEAWYALGERKLLDGVE